MLQHQQQQADANADQAPMTTASSSLMPAMKSTAWIMPCLHTTSHSAAAAAAGHSTMNAAVEAARSPATAAAAAPPPHKVVAYTPPSPAAADRSATLEVSPTAVYHKTGPVRPIPPAAAGAGGFNHQISSSNTVGSSSSGGPQTLSHLIYNRVPAGVVHIAYDHWVDFTQPSHEAAGPLPTTAAAVSAAIVSRPQWDAANAAMQQQQQQQHEFPAPQYRATQATQKEYPISYLPPLPTPTAGSNPPFAPEFRPPDASIPPPPPPSTVPAPATGAPMSRVACCLPPSCAAVEVSASYSHSITLPPDRISGSHGCDLDAARIIADLERLRTVYQTLSNCVVCAAAPRTVVLMPCKHLALCEGCSARMQTSGSLATEVDSSAVDRESAPSGGPDAGSTAGGGNGRSKLLHVEGICPMCGAVVEQYIAGVIVSGV